jgi:hypothetical protein
MGVSWLGNERSWKAIGGAMRKGKRTGLAPDLGESPVKVRTPRYLSRLGRGGGEGGGGEERGVDRMEGAKSKSQA